MSLSHSPSVVTDGLILALDAANRKSYIGAAPASLINTDSWTVSSGSVAGYNQNGSTVENTRLYDTDPWGNQSIVWGTYASGDGNADGGWNTDYPAIDSTKLYRFSVWVRRTSATSSGTFYYGTGGGGGEVRRTDNSATQGNPYWDCQNTGVLTQNQWYLVCGHIYPHFTTYAGKHPNTGYFTVAGGTTKVMETTGCTVGQDLKWDPASTSAVHRTYHYYCGDATTRLQFMAPRIDLCDGNEPSISELLTNGNSVWKDVSGNSNHGKSTTTLGYADRTFNFNGTTDRILVTNNIFNRTTSQEMTASCWIKPSRLAGVYNTLINCRTDATYNWMLYMHATDGALSFHGASQNKTTVIPAVNAWSHVAQTVTAAGVSTLYVNGVSAAVITGYTYNLTTPGQIGIGAWGTYTGESFQGSISQVQIYNRALSANEVKQNFQAIRGRYSI